jgi:O-antigen ligase
MIEKVLTEGSVLYRGMRFFLAQGRTLWDKPFLFTPTVFALSIAVAASGLLDGIRPFFLLYLIVAIVISVNLKNAFLGFFLTFLFTLQFVHPNKSYSVEVIRGGSILEPVFSEGYSIGYFFHLASFFFLLSGAMFLKEVVLLRKRISRPLGITLIALCSTWLAFSLMGAYGISRYSPYVFLSSVWLAQYGMMYFVALGICFGLAMYPKFRSVLFATLAVIVGTQLLVSILQLLYQRSAGFHFESESVGSFATGLDENNAVFRVMGTFMFANQLAFIIGILSGVLLPYGLEKRSLVFSSLGLLGIFIVILTQSRSALLGVAVLTLICLVQYRNNLKHLIAEYGSRRLFFYFLVAFTLSGFGIIPRILMSVNAGYDGAGLSIRVRMVNEAVQAIAANPLVGYGVGTNEYVLHRLFPNGVMTVFPAVVHLGYLQLWLEVGLLGLAVFLTPMIFLLRYCLMPRGHAELPQYFRIGLINGVVVALVFWLLLPHIGIIEFPFLGIPLGLGSFWYYLARSDKKGI